MTLSEKVIIRQLSAHEEIQLNQYISTEQYLSVLKLTCYFNTDDLFSFNVHNPE